jgi:hypothetical protein
MVAVWFLWYCYVKGDEEGGEGDAGGGFSLYWPCAPRCDREKVIGVVGTE